MYRIFIVEDDGTIADIMKTQLEAWGYTVACVETFDDVMEQFTGFGPQLVLLDISLPHRNGFHWCREIRKVSKVPVMFISSASDAMNMVTAINMGADDFIAKPFDLPVLMAKVQALLRRAYEFDDPAELMEHKGVIFSVGEGAIYHDGKRVELTRNEHRILHTLMQSRGKTVSREEIMQRLWEHDSYVDDNTLTVNVTRLRKRLEEIGVHDFIHTRKGEGYRLE